MIRITPGRLVSELTVSRCAGVTLSVTPGAASLLDVDVITVTT